MQVLAELLAYPASVAARRHVIGDIKRMVDTFKEANKNLNPVGMSEVRRQMSRALSASRFLDR